MPLRAPVNSRHRAIELCWTVVGLCAAALMVAPGAQAQALHSAGSGSPADVTIDTGVLDALGPALTVPGLLLAPGEHAALRRPEPHHPESHRHVAMRRHKRRVVHAAHKPAHKFAIIHLTPPPRPTAVAAKAAIPPTAATPAPTPAPTPTVTTTAPAPVATATPAPAPAAAAPATPVLAATTTPAAMPMTTTAQPVAQPAVAVVSAAAVASPIPSAQAASPAGRSMAIPVAAPAAVAGALSVVRFEAGVSEIPAAARPLLDSVATRLLYNETLRRQLVAYASRGAGEDPIEARRISLARAVTVRAYLIEKGVHSFRMDVRALGDRTAGGGPPDRVDLVILDH